MTWTVDEKRAAEAEAASWEGTPHMQRRRIKGRGVDCVNLVMAVLEAGGQVPHRKAPQYRQHMGATTINPVAAIIRSFLNVQTILEPDWQQQTGDIVIWRPIARTNHCGIVAGDAVWHASVGQGVVGKTVAATRPRIQEVLRLRSKGYLVDDPATIRIT